tara:strand:+ start:287 stop:508 length:222 start_codon:yes stop_codon:yes gene_type:complete
MAKLNKAQRKGMADIIESLMIAQSAQTKHIYNVGTVKDLRYWQRREEELTLKLYEEYGIELCTLSLAQETNAA